MLILCLIQAVVRPNGGHAVVLNWSMFTLYGMNKHEVFVICSHFTMNSDNILLIFRL